MSLDEWAKRIVVAPSVLSDALKEIKDFEVANISRRPNGNITIISRRQIREEKEKENNRIRQRRYYTKQHSNSDLTGTQRDRLELETRDYSLETTEEKTKTLVPPRGETVWKVCEEIIAFLNEKTKKSFQARHPNGDPTKALQAVQSLLRKGYTALNLRQVIANRCLKWRDDPKMEEFLRPETLFRPANFSSYFGELGKGMSHESVSGVS